jgi:hypothetical protein
MLLSDLDIYRSANEHIKQHGEDAAIHAAMKADKFLAASDLDGAAVWRRIGRAIAELEAQGSADGVRH